MKNAPQTVLTVGPIARQLNEPLHRVEYAIRTRNIQPIGIAGHARIFSADVVEQIATVLRDIDAQREAATRRDT